MRKGSYFFARKDNIRSRKLLSIAQDINTSVKYLTFAVAMWFSGAVDLCLFLYNMCVVLGFTLLQSSAYASDWIWQKNPNFSLLVDICILYTFYPNKKTVFKTLESTASLFLHEVCCTVHFLFKSKESFIHRLFLVNGHNKSTFSNLFTV